MKIAIVHDWLVTYAGAERVLEQMINIYPQSHIYTLINFMPQENNNFLQNHTIKTSFIQNLPFAKKIYRKYLPLMPLAIEQFDLSQYDLVLSSSHAVAKGVLTGPHQLHISYVHSPIRYAWDLQHQYLKESGLDRGLKGWLAKWMLHKIRLWDARTANGVDVFIANSQFIARRIWKVYRREAQVIYPPVDVDSFTCSSQKEDFYLTASRMVPYKRIDLIVEAFSQMPDRRLIVIGDGPDFKKIRAKAGKNVQFLGYQPATILRDYMQRARAFVFAAEEDFGIAPVEAQACGTPVIAYGRGGVKETVRGLECQAPTGIFFEEQTTEAIKKAIENFESVEDDLSPQVCRANVERFSSERFRNELKMFIENKFKEFIYNK